MSEAPNSNSFSKGLNFYHFARVLLIQLHLESVKEEAAFHLIDK